MPRKNSNQPPLDFSDEFDMSEVEEAAKTVLKEKEKPPRDGADSGAGVLLFIIAIVFAVRFGLYIWVEDWGQRYWVAGLLADGLVFLVGYIFDDWGEQVWNEIKWLMVPDALTLVASFVICCMVIAEKLHSVALPILSIALCLLAASPFWLFVMKNAMDFLNDPVGWLKK